jgi:Flp pilus assembly protein TadG
MAAATRPRDATSVTAMFAKFNIRHICNAARRFVGANDGNIAVIFTLAAIPVIGFVGAAIDYSRTNSARSSVQSALDSTALMLAKDVSSGIIAANSTAVQLAAQAYFTSLYTNPDGKAQPINSNTTNTVSATYTPNNGNMGNTIQLTVTAQVTTDFMKVVSSSLSTVNFTVTSTTAWGNVKMRVALALDNTGSMNDNGKIGALRTAVAGNGGLIDQLSALAKNDGDVYISVIPFAKDVNVGNSNQAWIDWTDWNAANGTCSRSFYTTQSSCVNAGKTWTPANHTTWTGCVTDRTQNYDTLNTAPVAAITDTFFPAEEYYENSEYYCKPGNQPPLQQIQPLTYNWSSLKTMVNAMQPTGGTNQPIGLAWAWLSLTQTAPMTAPVEDSNYQYNRVIIILSDGLNTEDRWPSYGNGSSQFGGQIDARQQILCNNIKNPVDPKTNKPMYTIYAIQVNTSSPPDPTSTVLQNCASDPSKFFMLTSSGQIATTFTTIGTALSQLRVAQ